STLARVEEFRSVRVCALYAKKNIEGDSAGTREGHKNILATRRGRPLNRVGLPMSDGCVRFPLATHRGKGDARWRSRGPTFVVYARAGLREVQALCSVHSRPAKGYPRWQVRQGASSSGQN